ncbi:hypothetical protein [Streptomyces sp. NPDC003077]
MSRATHVTSEIREAREAAVPRLSSPEAPSVLAPADAPTGEHP